MRISIIGVYPPPRGGVSIHVMRLAEKLEKDKFLSKVYDMWRNQYSSVSYPGYVEHFSKKGRLFKYDTFSSIYWLFLKLRKDNADIIHFQEAPLYTSLTFILVRVFFRKKIVFSVHDKMQLTRIHNVPGLIRVWFYLLIRVRIASKWIAVSGDIKNQLVSLKVKEEDIHVIPAYLPNTEEDSLDEKLLLFLKDRELKICFYSQRFQDDDIYGCWDTIKIAKKLNERYKNWGLIMCIPSIKDLKQMSLLKQYLHENNLEKNVLVYEEFISSLSLLFKNCDLYLRPTSTDGDAVSIREAIFSNCVPVASDIVERPFGCITHKTGDAEDLFLKVRYVIENLDYLKNSLKVDVEDFYEKLLNIYQEIVEW